MQAFLDKIGSSFFVASFIPALAFLILAIVVFEPMVPSLSTQIPLLDPPNRPGLFLLTLAIVLGFTLSSLNTFNLKLFQGDYLFHRIGWMKRKHQKQALKLLRKIRMLEKIIREGYEEKRITKLQAEVLTELKNQVAEEYVRRYPYDLRSILPTEFGNVYRAAEYYPKETYGINKIAVWPRLMGAISKDYYNKLEQSENIVLFVINSSLLAIIMAVLCVIAAIRQITMSVLADNTIYLQSAIFYLIACFLSVTAFFVFYKIAVQNAMLYGNMVRGAFDLFRFDLLKQLRMPLPVNSEFEFQDWGLLSEFLSVGSFAGPMVPFEYHHPKDSAQEKTEESGSNEFGGNVNDRSGNKTVA